MRDPGEELVVEVGGGADDEMRRPTARVRLRLRRDAGRPQRRGQAEREHEVGVGQLRLPPHPQERHAGEQAAVVVRDLCFLHLNARVGERCEEPLPEELVEREDGRVLAKEELLVARDAVHHGRLRGSFGAG